MEKLYADNEIIEIATTNEIREMHIGGVLNEI